MDERAKKLILARRAKFVAAAMAGVGMGSASCGGETKEGAEPQPCLSFAAGGVVNVGGAGGAPQACLTPASGGTLDIGGGPAMSGGAVGSGGLPQPCLSAPADGGGPNPGTGGTSSDAGVDAMDSDAGDAAVEAAPPKVDAAPLPCLTPVR